jgi:beta-lactamase regulating signal transducer with metallopeptidase domain
MEINSELIRSLGMALVHSLWQGPVILVLVLFALALAGRSNARLRYVMLVSGHFLLLAAFLATWYITYHHNMATAIKPLTRVYSQVGGLVGTSPIAIKTAGYTATLSQFLDPLYPVMAMGWTLGFIFMLIRMTGGFYFSYNIIRKDILIPDASLLALFAKAKTRLMMPDALKLRMSTRPISPMVIGILKPCVIVPAAILSGLNTEQVEAIMVHELAHIRRYDHLVMIIQAIVSQILFFHPVAWYLSSEINRERENCCDDLVIKSFRNPINYIKALTMIQELNADGQVPANALLGRSKRLLGRVKRLLKTEKRHAPVFRMAVILLLLFTLGIAAITIASAGNQGTGKTMGRFFLAKPGKIHMVADTIKTKKHSKTTGIKESNDPEERTKQKEMMEARRKLEKAQLEMQKAQLELEKAREEFMRAGGQMRSHDMANLSEDQAKHLMMEDQMREFKLEHEKEFNNQRRAMELQRRAMEGHMRLRQDVMRERMRHVRPEEWKHDMKEWEKAGKEMDEAGKEFYKAWKDSGNIWEHPDPFLSIPPVPPVSPEVPSSVFTPEIPDPAIVAPQEPVVPSELMMEEQEQQELENTKPLDSKLKELEDDEQ